MSLFLGVMGLAACNAVNPAFDELQAEGSGTDAKPTTTDTPATTSVGMTSDATTTAASSSSGTRPETDTQLDTRGEDTGIEDTGPVECKDEVDPRIYSRCGSPSCEELRVECLTAASEGPVVYAQGVCLQECESDCDCQHSLDGEFAAICEPGVGCIIECVNDSECPGGMVCNEDAQLCLWNEAYGLCDDCVGDCYSIFEGLYEFCSPTDCSDGVGARDTLCPEAPGGATATPSCVIDDKGGSPALGCALRCSVDAECPGEMVCRESYCFHANVMPSRPQGRLATSP